jgi:uncharacterized protein (UPF0276 family)
MAAGIVALREASGLEVLPENPPGSAFVGDLHLLEFFARVAEAADTGLLLDCAHLAMYQRLTGHAPLDGFDHVPWDRVVELHVAGGREREVDGFQLGRGRARPSCCRTRGRSRGGARAGRTTCGRWWSSASATRSRR